MSIRNALVFTALSLSACNHSNGIVQTDDMGGTYTAPDMTQLAQPDLSDDPPPSNTYPAKHPDPPQVITGGGPVLTAPVFVPIFFSNDDATQKASLEDFVAKVGATNYWITAVQEYGVGAATAAKPVELTEAAPATLDDNGVQTWLAGKLNGNDAAFPQPTGNSLYIINYPATTTITMQSGPGGGSSQSCQTFGGYHSNLQLDTKHNSMMVAYAVIPRCSGAAGLDEMQTTTGSTSHEMVEAATDPYPQDQPAYGQVDNDHLFWIFGIGGGENGDMCAQNPGAFHQFPELNYTVQRIWSNASVSAGHDPCIPTLPNEVYFNSVPELNDMVTVLGQYQMLGVQVPVGTTKTIDLDLYSDADTHGPWTVKVVDSSTIMGGGASDFKFSLDRNQGQNGEKLHLTITTMKKGQYGVGIFYIISTLGNQKNLWLGLIGEG
jgi:hypothetical protein